MSLTNILELNAIFCSFIGMWKRWPKYILYEVRFQPKNCKNLHSILTFTFLLYWIQLKLLLLALIFHIFNFYCCVHLLVWWSSEIVLVSVRGWIVVFFIDCSKMCQFRSHVSTFWKISRGFLNEMNT
jgi:hypothetical protein